MKKIKKQLISLLCGALLLFSPMAARATEAPYQPFALDQWGSTMPVPSGYLPTRSIGGAELGLGDFKDASDTCFVKVTLERLIYAVSVDDFFLSALVSVDNSVLLVYKTNLNCFVAVVFHCLDLCYHTRSSLKHGYGN